MSDLDPSDDLEERLLRQQADQPGENDQLLALVYDQLRDLAARMLARQAPGHTLQATALVHEAWLKMARTSDASWEGRSHFMGVASKAMRQVLVNHARDRKADKRGGGDSHRVTLDDCLGVVEADSGDVVALDEALQRLAAIDPRRARVVEMRVFAGASIEETAEALDVGTTTVKTDWRIARAWLRRELPDLGG